ncbi:MAG: helix-turn-helix domain-containing protein, partial [Chitinophaga rupis]
VELESQRVYCVAPDQVHQFLPDEDAEGFSIAFTESFPNDGDYDMNYPGWSLPSIGRAGGVFVNEDVWQDLELIMKKLCQEFNNLYPFKLQIIKRYLRILLTYLSRHLSEGKPVALLTRDKELVDDFISLVDKHFKETKMVAEYANRLSITPNYLNEVVKKNTGYPAGHHIRQRVVLEAKRMSLYTRTNMKQIAYSLGFSDCGHFSKFFKTATGKNFSDFKREKLAVAMV